MSFAEETLDAAAVKKLLSGNTVEGLSANSGNTFLTYFTADGKLVRKDGDKITEGVWRVEDDGKQCVEGVPGGCAMIVKNDDGSYDRKNKKGVVARWLTITPGKGF